MRRSPILILMKSHPRIAIDCKIEQCTVTQPLLAIQVESDGPYLPGPKGALCAELASRVPRSPSLGAWVVHRMSHGVFSVLTRLAGGDLAPRSITTEGVGRNRDGLFLGLTMEEVGIR